MLILPGFHTTLFYLNPIRPGGGIFIPLPVFSSIGNANDMNLLIC